MYETTLHGNEFASFLQGRPGLIPSDSSGMGVHRLSPD